MKSDKANRRMGEGTGNTHNLKGLYPVYTQRTAKSVRKR